MRQRLLFSFFMLLISACQTIPYQRMKSKALFTENVVGKQLSWPGGYRVKFSHTGEINGHFPNGDVTGEWHWKDEKFCRSIRINRISKPYECLVIEYNGDQLRFKRNDGSYFLPYRIENPN